MEETVLDIALSPLITTPYMYLYVYVYTRAYNRPPAPHRFLVHCRVVSPHFVDKRAGIQAPGEQGCN